MGIRVHCFTNLDQFKKEEWPERMAARPIKGDWVKSKRGKILMVVGVTHVDGQSGSFLRVELHKVVQ